MKKQLTVICIIGILLVVGLSGCLNGDSNPKIHLFTVTPDVIIQGQDLSDEMYLKETVKLISGP